MLVSLERRITPLVVADAVNHRHENGIVRHSPGSLFVSDLVLRLLLEKQNGCEGPVARLKRIFVQVNAGDDAGLANEPFPDVPKPWRAQDGVREDDAHPTAGLEKLEAALDEKLFRGD